MTDLAFELKVYDRTHTNFLGFMPDFESIEAMNVISDVGVLTLGYPSAGINANLLTQHKTLYECYFDGVYVLTGVLEDVQNDEIAETGLYTITMRNTMGEFAGATLYPPNWPTKTPIFTHYASATAGSIMRAAITKSQARGELSGWTVSFTDTVDSSGASWGTLTQDYEAGTSLLKMIQDLSSNGWAEFKAVGRRLDAYVAGTMGVDVSSSVRLRSSRDFLDAPRHASSREMFNVALVQGDAAAFVEVTDAGSIAMYGRISKGINAGNISDNGTLTQIGQSAIGLSKDPRDQKARGLQFDPVLTPRPYTAYDLGYKIGVDDPNGAFAYRVKQITLREDNKGTLSGAIVLNDRFDDLDTQFNRQLQGLTGGAGGAGSTSNNPPPATSTDLTVPSAVGTLTVSSTPYQLPDGSSRDNLTATWTAVTTNTDGTAITDLAGYQLQYRPGTIAGGQTAWTDAQVKETEFVSWSSVKTAIAVVVRVRAFDQSGHYSAWTQVDHTTAADTIAPPTPSTPTADTTLFAGTLRIVWDGKDNTAANMSNVLDFAAVEVHASTVSGFTPSQATMRDEFTTVTGGVTDISTPVGTPYYVKFVARDTQNNRSSASVEVTATARQANDGELAALSIGKLLVGSLVADMTVSARIKTANTGARVELNTNGIELFNSSNVRTVFLEAATGNATFTGTITGSTITGGLIRSAASGQRIEIDSATGDRIKFFTGSGSETANGALQVLSAGDLYLFPPKLTSSGNQVPLIDMINLGPGNAFMEFWGERIIFNPFGTLEFSAPNNILVKNLMLFNDGTYSSGKAWLTFRSSVFSDDYTFYADNVGTVAGSTSRLWLDGPNQGEVTIGPRSGSANFGYIRLRTDLLNCFFSTTTANAANMYRGTNGDFAKSTSSLKYKTDLVPLDTPLWEVLELTPFKYRSLGTLDIEGGHSREFIGLAAEDADMLGLHELVDYDAEGEPDWLMYERIAPLLIPIIKDLKQRLEALEAV